jgi:hypothetical protein
LLEYAGSLHVTESQKRSWQSFPGNLANLLGKAQSNLSVAWLAGTPFSDYTIPGLLLAMVVGGSALLAATTVFIHRMAEYRSHHFPTRQGSPA